ncbi:hypothetical protein [Breoghania sp.]|uniref:hypothetical protein n=1 Tax=Breoghania sp. TaxID=2065378 RepID=UPI002AA67033|nr:hypothetical protein [Breoghania sp.]
MTDAIENGRKLARSARNIAFAGKELEAMLVALREMLQNETDRLGRIEDDDDEFVGGGEWIRRAYGYNANVFENVQRRQGQKGRLRNGERLGTITMLVRLCGDPSATDADVDWPWIDQACLIVGWHNHEDEREEFWWAEHFEISSENLLHIKHINQGLWSWQLDDCDYAYFYVIPIFELNSEEKLKKYVVDPLVKLFHQEGSIRELNSAFEGVPVLSSH